MSVFRFEGSVSRFRVSGLGVQVSGFGFRYVFETLHLCSLTHTLSLVGTSLLPVDRIPDEGVCQRNVCKDRCQPPKIVLIWSVENVADPTCGVKLSREATHHIDPRCETSLLSGLPAPHHAQPAPFRTFRFFELAP